MSLRVYWRLKSEVIAVGNKFWIMMLDELIVEVTDPIVHPVSQKSFPFPPETDPIVQSEV